MRDSVTCEAVLEAARKGKETEREVTWTDVMNITTSLWREEVAEPKAAQWRCVSTFS